MSFYGGMKITHVNAPTELKLEKKLREIELAHENGMIRVINVYKSGTGYTAWYYHDWSKAGPPARKEEGKDVVKKKVTKKKTRKKAGN